MGLIEIKGKKLEKLHNVQIEILDEIVRICEKNNIEYFLQGGTLLGAVRHGGFIPWDDDLDISMYRKDYDKFISICEKELKKEYRLDCDKTNGEYWLTFAKIRKRNTLFLEKALDGIDVGKEIYVDIFPMDDVVKPLGILNHIRVIIMKIIIDALLYKRGVTKDINECRRPKLTKIFGCLSYKILHSFYYRLATISNSKKAKFVTDFASPYNYKKETHLKENFFPTTFLKFENNKYRVPKKYKIYLEQVYGDYMKLPPENERVNHSALDVKFNIK